MPQAPGPFALRLANNEVSRLIAADGGLVYADVLGQVHGSEHFARKRLGPPKYEDFSLRVGASMSRGLFDWLAASWTAQAPKRNGSLLMLGNGLDIRTEQEFTGALIAETTFPALETASSDFVNLTVRFTPAFVRWKKGVGTIPPGPSGPRDWISSNFRIEIDGLDCTRVTRIDSFTVKRRVTTASSGSGESTLSAGTVDFPNLTITLPESRAASWYDWHDDFVVQGHNDDSRERRGVLRFLTPNFATELARLELYRLGIIKITRRTVSSGTTQGVQVTAELYCEQMKFSMGGGSP
jgi:hypothetical protein